MKFHPEKCNVLTISKKRSPSKYNYTLHGHILEHDTSAKYLGCWMSFCWYGSHTELAYSMVGLTRDTYAFSLIDLLEMFMFLLRKRPQLVRIRYILERSRNGTPCLTVLSLTRVLNPWRLSSVIKLKWHCFYLHFVNECLNVFMHFSEEIVSKLYQWNFSTYNFQVKNKN
jgi:hypothetical protein